MWPIQCEGCYQMMAYNKIKHVKGYFENGNWMSEQKLCAKCFSLHQESRIDFLRFERWKKTQAKKKEEE